MRNFKRSFGLTALVAMGVAGCNDGLTDINQNPNAPETAPAATLFLNGTRLGITRWMGTSNKRAWELLSQHLAEVQYPETDAYNRLVGASTEGNFNAAYSGELRDLQVVINEARAGNEPGLWAPALVYIARFSEPAFALIPGFQPAPTLRILAACLLITGGAVLAAKSMLFDRKAASAAADNAAA